MSFEDQEINLRPWAMTRGFSALGLMALGLIMGFQKPETPTILVPENGKTFKETIVKIKGKAAPGSIVVIERARTDQDRKGNKSYAIDTLNADAEGNWESEHYFDEGPNTIWTYYEMNGGTKGANSESVKFTIKSDFEANMSKALEITSHEDNGQVLAGDVVITGRAPAGARVMIQIDGRKEFRKAADETGSWAFNLSMKKGTHKVKVQTLTILKSTQEITLTAK